MEKPTLGRNESVKKKTKYNDESTGGTRVVKDFLPPPEKLVLKESNVKITISLSKASVDFFKKEAKKHSTSYQKMIRRVIDVYTEKYKKTA